DDRGAGAARLRRLVGRGLGWGGRGWGRAGRRARGALPLPGAGTREDRAVSRRPTPKPAGGDASPPPPPPPGVPAPMPGYRSCPEPDHDYLADRPVRTPTNPRGLRDLPFELPEVSPAEKRRARDLL